MTNNSMKSLALQSEAETAVHLLDDWFDPIEAGLRDRVRELIQAMIALRHPLRRVPIRRGEHDARPLNLLARPVTIDCNRRQLLAFRSAHNHKPFEPWPLPPRPGPVLHTLTRRESSI
jgi:hypothetical protein